MNKKHERAINVAEFLLKIKAIELRPEQPFTWASGLKSPIYCDNRKTLSYPKVRTFIRQQFVDLIQEEFGTPDVIAGVATGGIAIGALVAQELGLPFVYVRSEAKKHGLTNKIEGVLESGQNVVVIEDLISTGGSSLDAVKALREVNARVTGLVAIFTYGFQKSVDSFAAAKCPLATLTEYDALVQKAIEEQYINGEHLETLKNWRNDPEAWSKARSEVNAG